MAELTGLPIQEIIRMCAGIGLIHLKKINFDIHNTIYQAAAVAPRSAKSSQSHKTRKSNNSENAPEKTVAYPGKKRSQLRVLKPSRDDQKAN